MRARQRLVATANVALLGVIGLAVTVGAAPTALASAHQTRPSWLPASSPGTVASLVKGAPARGPVRVVTVTLDRTGHPRLHVTTTAGRAAAALVIRDAGSEPGTVAVSIDHRTSIAAVSNDTYRTQQWALDKLRAETAWSLHTAAGKTVAVIDTGVDATHPDLTGHVISGAQFLNSTTSTGNGMTDPNGHGTHVSGIIGATANNAIGVAGLAQGVTILPIRVLDANGSGWNSDIASGVIYAADHGVTAINMSLGGSYADASLASAVRYAQSKDVVVVAAAGNGRQSGNPVSYPGGFPGVLAVAATDATNASASFSETGSYVGIAAPGVGIVSTYPGSQYVSMSGTSMATPFVVAAVALVRAAAPALTATAAITDLTSTADDLGTPGRDDFYGAGLVDPVAALQAATRTAPTPAPTTTASAPAPTTTTVPAPTTTTVPAPTTTAPRTTAPTPVTVSAGLALSTVSGTSGAAVQAAVTVRSSSGAAVAGRVTFCTQEISGTLFCGGTFATVNGAATTLIYPQVGVDVYAKFSANPMSGLAVTDVVSQTIRLNETPLVQVTGDMAAVSVSVNPARSQLVTVQRLVSGTWTAVASHAAATSAAWRFTGLAAGSYRTVVPATSQLLATTSATVTVR